MELEDQINFLLKTPLTPQQSSSQAFIQAISPDHQRAQAESQNLAPFTFQERTGLSPQPKELETTFEARVRDYMAAHAERMERFENAILKQHEMINDRMTEMFRLLNELAASRAPRKVLIKEELRHPVTKDVNSISLVLARKEGDTLTNEVVNGSTTKPSNPKKEEPKKNNNVKCDGPTKTATKDESPVEASCSRTLGYYLKNKINEKLIEGLTENRKFNDSLSHTGKVKQKTYNLSQKGPLYDAILKKKIARKEEIGGILNYHAT